MPLSPRMPELGALEILSAIAKTGSLSAAGREVGLTQQAVSARLTSIESQTGVRLVTRTTRGSQLTPAGFVVAEWADQLLDVNGEQRPTSESLELSSAAAVRAAVLAGAGPAVMSRLAVRDDLAEGRLRAIPVGDLELRRELRAIWVGARTPPAGAVRDLLNHIVTGR